MAPKHRRIRPAVASSSSDGSEPEMEAPPTAEAAASSRAPLALAGTSSTSSSAGARQSSGKERVQGSTIAIAQRGGSNVRSLVQMNLFGRSVVAQPPIELAEREAATPEVPATPQAFEQGQAGTCSGISLATHERVRTMKRKSAPGPRGRAKAARITKETRIPVNKRLRQFPDQGFKESAGVLFCAPCREELRNHSEGIKRHILSKKHTDNFSTWSNSKRDDETLCHDIAAHFEANADEKGVCNSHYPFPSHEHD